LDQSALIELPGRTYDVRHIRSVLRFLQHKSRGMDATARLALLAQASRLPGLNGRFIVHQVAFAFHPDDGTEVVRSEEPGEGRGL
jgi:hypothetical protein